MRIKVCGVTHPGDAKLAAELGAWAVGLVLAPKSPRVLSFEQAAVVRAAVPPGVLAVGVFEVQEPEKIREQARILRLDAVQVHGAADPEAYRDFPVPVIWAVGLRPGEGTPSLPEWKPFAALVEPARTPEDRRQGRSPGREEKRRAWVTAGSLRGKGSLIVVAGGLTPENAAEAAKTAKPDVLDVCSGVESAPGIKNSALMRAFFAAVKNA